MRDMVEKGRSAKGESNGMSKLTTSEVREIRMIGKAMRQRDIGELYGISQPMVGYILNRQWWKHVKSPLAT